jgi:predicted metal-dependent hydrolase
VPRIPDDLAISASEAAVLGGSLLAEGRPFHAHEVFEAAWKTGPAAERDLWQGLAQIAVGITHARRGNAAGAVTLLRRGARRVGANRSSHNRLYGIDPVFVADRAEEIAAQIESNGLATVPEADLLLPMAPPAP